MKTQDPLLVLREDTYTDEENNEMVGKMIRKQYKESQEENFSTWLCTHDQSMQIVTYSFLNELEVIQDNKLNRYYIHKDGELVGEQKSTIGIKLDEWTEILTGVSKL
jgi:uncharacterized protein YgiM (DUF1202 family)